MANRRFAISMDSKDVLDKLCSVLEVERPSGVRIALAKGIASTQSISQSCSISGTGKWTVPDGIIKGQEYILFKHLIINEQNTMLDEENITKHLANYTEKGLLIIEQELREVSSLEDYRLSILTNA